MQAEAWIALGGVLVSVAASAVGVVVSVVTSRAVMGERVATSLARLAKLETQHEQQQERISKELTDVREAMNKLRVEIERRMPERA